MKNKTYTARENRLNALKIARKEYPSIFISDARFLNFKSQRVIAASFKNRILPYTQELLKKAQFLSTFEKSDADVILVDLNNMRFFYDKKEKPISRKLKKAANQIVEKLNNYGGKINERGEHIIDLSSSRVGPHFDVNLLLGNCTEDDDPLLKTPKSVVNSFGGGSFRGAADFQVSATKWGTNPYENGSPFNRQFYLLENGKQIFFSGEVDSNCKTATCIHSSNYTTITYIFDKLRVVRKIFILGKRSGNPDAVEIQNIEIENLSSKDRNIQLIAVGEFGFSNPDCQKVDIIYQTIINQTRIFTNEKNEIRAISPDYYPEIFRDKMRFASLRSEDGYAEAFTNNLEEFLDGGTYAHPNGISNFSSELQRGGASFFALKKSLKLSKNSTSHLSEIIGASYLENGEGDIVAKLEKDIGNLLDNYPKYEDLERCFQEDKRDYEKYTKFIQLKSKDDQFDSYVNNTLPFQVLYQSFVSRGFAQTQKGYREIGFREIQDLFASMYYLYNEGKEELIKKMLKYWIENVYEFGYANHNFYFTGKEPGMCSDDQLWLIQAIYRYVNLSGDVGFLLESFKMAGSNKKRKLYETLKAIVRYSAQISIGKHRLPLLDSCDWNDCLKIDDDYLDGPHKEKIYSSYLRRTHKQFGCPLKSDYSESVMNAFLLVIALKEMKELASMINDNEYAEEMKKMISCKEQDIQESAYIKGYFARVLINRKTERNISYIGAKGDGLSVDKNIDGSFYLNSFSWSLLSNVATEKQIVEMLNIVEKYLKTSAGFILCTDSDLSLAGSKQAATAHYYPGDRENGGVFKHAAMMGVVSMLKKSKRVKDRRLRERLVDNAFYMLELVLPYKTLENPYVLKGNPRFCTQYNNSKTMENIGPILSGTATWLNLAIYEILGLEYTRNKIIICPVLPRNSEGLNANLNLRGTLIKLNIIKDKNKYIDLNKLVIEVDGKRMPSLEIPRLCDKKEHSIVIKENNI
ncbi:MAG: glycosyl transferase [Bacilli bacterium]